MISKKKAIKNNASKKSPKRNKKASKATATPQAGQPEKTQKVKSLRGVPKEIRDKMARACERVAKEVKKHPEYAYSRLPEVRFRNNSKDKRHYCRWHSAEVWAEFQKYGKTIMVVPSCMMDRDYDYPDLTDEGYRYLRKTIYDAAKAEGLRIGGRTKFSIENVEKGLCILRYIYTVWV